MPSTNSLVYQENTEQTNKKAEKLVVALTWKLYEYNSG